MKAMIFPSRNIEDLNYILLEDGHFGGAFNSEVPQVITDGYDIEFISGEDAHTHEGLLKALDLNRKLFRDKTPVIYVFSEKPDNEPGIYFAMAESGWVLGVAQCRNAKRALWTFGLKALEHCPYKAEYDRHYPEGFEIKQVLFGDIKAHQGLSQARVQNQMLADIKGESPKQGAE